MTPIQGLERLQELVELVRKFLAIGEAGQGVVASLIVDRIGHPLELGDVAEGEEETIDGVLLLVDASERAIDDEGLAEGVLERDLAEEVGLLVDVGRFADHELALGSRIDEGDDRRGVLPLGRSLAPAGNPLGHRVHEAYVELRVCRHDTVVDGVEDGRKKPLLLAELAIYGVFVERYVDGRVELALLERLEDVSEGLDFLGALEGLLVGIGGEENDGNAVLVANLAGGLDPVHGTSEHDVHEDDIGLAFLGEADRLHAVGSHAHDRVSEALEPTLQIEGDYLLVLNY